LQAKPVKNIEWNLKLLYQSPDDPQIERDVQAIEKAYDDFAKKYASGMDHLNSEQKLLKSLEDWDELTRITDIWKPASYFSKISDIESSNAVAQANLARITNRLTSAANKIIFYLLSLGKIPAGKQAEYLKSPVLEPYRHFLSIIFETAKHDLTEPEERILNLKTQPAYLQWVQGQEKVLNGQTVAFKGKKISIPAALGKLSELPHKDRRALFDATNEVLKGISGFAEAEMNAIIMNKKIDDEIRGFTEPYENTFLAYQSDKKSILNLVDTVNTHAGIARRFYKLKAKMLKLKNLEHADTAAKIGKDIEKVFSARRHRHRTEGSQSG
jgi:oligoendopeptidase F